MFPRNRSLSAATLLFALQTLISSSAHAHSAQIVPHPDHPDPCAIHLESSRVSMDIEAGVAHTTLTQVFVNPNSWQAEGIYLFPLPEGAAVIEFQLTMDGVPVSGDVLDR